MRSFVLALAALAAIGLAVPYVAPAKADPLVVIGGDHHHHWHPHHHDHTVIIKKDH
jgi:hypothetical protein